MKNYIQDILDKFTSTRYSTELEKEILHWLADGKHADVKDEALRTVWENTHAEADASTRASLRHVYDRVHADSLRRQPAAKVSHTHSGWVKYAAAAVALVAVSVSATYFIAQESFEPTDTIEHLTRAGETSTIILPDGSEVRTNSGSILLYPEEFKSRTRTVYLIGEADFKVAKNPEQPFIVRSTSVAVTALGTEFNVAAYPEQDEIVATLIKGKVRVDCNQGENSFILSPGQQVCYNKLTSQAQLSEADLNYVTAWQKGIIVLRSMTMHEVLSTLKRHYGTDFKYNERLFNDDKYNFRFSKDDPLDKVMSIIQQVAGGFDFHIEAGICSLQREEIIPI